ncbi:MAG: NAD-dependent epimerase/dehydratase family protein [Candidatus Marinimicrobia bacterium]|nr:NAD-dependent epimerase/dehydratase family protein [Candidatus Neomarinimicrobiota bacterium]
MTKCLIFGGNGFIGSHLAEGLVKKGYAVTVFDNFKIGRMNLDTVRDKIEIIKGNFLNESDVRNALKDVDYVFHYICTTTPATAMKDTIYDIESNIIGSVKLFQNAVDNNVKKIIFPSSGGTIYGETTGGQISESYPVNPVNPYAISKLTIEKYLHYFNYVYGIDYTILRYSNPYGERQNPYGKQGVIPIFLNKIKHGEQPVIYGDGSTIRDYIYIEDAVDATIAILEKKRDEKIFNVGSGKGTSLNELIDIMSGVVSQRVVPEYIKDTGIYIPKIVLDISRIQKVTGWKLTTELCEGINKTWEWIKTL